MQNAKNNKDRKNYSVLMSVYYKDDEKWLKDAINSMLNQTIKTNDFVIVEDGKLPENLENVIRDFEKKYKETFNIIRNEKNQGLGPALAIGIKECKNELIARMDSDDYSVIDRCEKQIDMFEKDEELGLIGSNIAEFVDSIENVKSYRILPQNDKEIKEFARRRNPFGHPSIMFKKSEVIKAGNYRNYYLCEDYDLWIRMIQKGVKCYNFKEVLVYMRINDNFYKRRGGIKYLNSILKFKKEQYNNGFYSFKDFIISSTAHIVVCLSPNFVRDWFYKRILRKKNIVEKNEKVKVLEIVPNMQQGGLENLVMNILRNIDRNKFEIHFLYHYNSNYYFDDEIIKLGGIIHKCSFRQDRNLFKYKQFLKQFFKENQFDVVHSHMLSTSYFTLKYAKKNGCKILINHSHNSTTEKTLKGYIKKFMISKSTKYANVYLACSKEAGKFAYPKRNFEVINNCIDLEAFKYSEINRKKVRNELKINKDDFVIGNIGRLNIQKNQLFLLECFSKVNLKNKKLLIIGTGELKDKILKKIKELHIENEVILKENVDSKIYYSAIDCFVLPSIFEGFPLTAIEAQANGCPCIFSNRISEDVKLNKNVKFCDVEDKKKWINIFSDFKLKRISNLSTNLKEYDIAYLIKKITSIYSQKIK